MEKLRNPVFVLIADQLASRLLQAFRRPLILDDKERNTIDEANDIATLRLGAAGPLDRKFCRHMKCVVLGSVPINEAKRVAFRVPVNRLGDRRPEHKRVVDILVGTLQTFESIRSRLTANSL